MLTFFKNSAIVLALAGTAMVVGTAASAQGFAIGVTSNGGNRSAISVGFGDVAIGYSDGYWDNSHRWHRWRNARDHDNYRRQHAGSYSNWKHDRDGNDGWRGGRNDNRRDRGRNH